MKKIIINIVIQAILTFLLSLLMFWLLTKTKVILGHNSIFVLAAASAIGSMIASIISEFKKFKKSNNYRNTK